MKTYLVSGATGFVGRELVPELEKSGDRVVRLIRRSRAAMTGDDVLEAGDDFKDIDRVWPSDFRPDCVIHLAARVHVMHDKADDPLASFRAVNVEATLRVAERAAQAGAKRFVFMSSIKAMGEASDPAHPLCESDPARPDDPYGISKREAELALLALGERTGMAIVIIRPPLVYGPGVGANFLSLLRAVARGWPLPLGKANAPRSLVSVENLVSAILTCADHPSAAGEIFHVSDGRDVTVAELIRLIGGALGRNARLIPVPVYVLRLVGTLTGRNESVRRLIEPLRLDVNKAQRQLGWAPQSSVESALARTAAWYRSIS